MDNGFLTESFFIISFTLKFNLSNDLSGSQLYNKSWDVELFCVGARLTFSMLLLGAELIIANLPPGAGLFWRLENVATPREH